MTASDSGQRSWTAEQLEAIGASGCDLLVSAAAGSGKTAVLVERMIRKIADDRNPTDVDRLLVVTFTNAAAAEMRERIRAALEARIAERPESARLRRQLALLGRAPITTIHAFCRDVLAEHGHRLSLDPRFRVADEVEAQLIRREVLDDLLEEEYGEGDGLFLRLADWLADEHGGDGRLAELIEGVYLFSRSHPWPDHWLEEAVARFAEAGACEAPERLEEAPGAGVWFRAALEAVRLELEGVAGRLDCALRLALTPGGPESYASTLREDLKTVRRLAEAAQEGWRRVHAAFADASFGRLKASRSEGVDRSLQERVKKLRDDAKKRLEELRGTWFSRTPEQHWSELGEFAPFAGKLAELVRKFGEKYRRAKADRGLVDFSDLEHFCLAILRGPDSAPGRETPSDVALEYRERFEEVLIDEYQDTNRVQETIVALLSRERPGNRFMVGDVKQSIYRFRLAEPELFMEKMRLYSKTGGAGGRRLDLSRNFRSRAEIVEAVNFLFRRLMRRETAEIDYDADAELVCGTEELPDGGDDRRTEVWVIDRERNSIDKGVDDVEDDDAIDELAGDGADEDPEASADREEDARLEARLIARRIRELMNPARPFRVYDKRLGALRPLAFRDVAVLLRSPQNGAGAMAEELTMSGIPAFSEASEGYFEATEVDVALSLLSIVDNPLQDIPFAAVLRSPIVGLNASQLVRVRRVDGRAPFYEAAVRFVAGEGRRGEPWEEQLADFIGRLERWRDEARRTPTSELVWRLLRETGYYDFCGALPGGRRRQANLRALVDRARRYETGTKKGLFGFLRLMDRLREQGKDLEQGRAFGENDDVVRIMSVHAAKGLEFPVVFLAGVGRRFNRRDEWEPFLVHRRLGIGHLAVDPEERVGRPTLPYLAIRRQLHREATAEEMRVLYVALTRAREKLILVGSTRSFRKEAAKWAYAAAGSGVGALPSFEIAEAERFLDWIGPALIDHPDASAWREAAGLELVPPIVPPEERPVWDIRIVGKSEVAAENREKPERPARDESRLRAVSQARPVPAPASAWRDELERVLAWRYPHGPATSVRSKTSVTEMKRLAERAFSGRTDGEPEPMWPAAEPFRTTLARRPRFLESRSVSPAERGSAYHAVMQRLPLVDPVDERAVVETIRNMVVRRLLSEEQARAVDPARIVRFFAQEIGRRVLASPRVMREVPFTLAIEASELETSLPVDSGETVVVQGVIDCLYEAEGGFGIIDFKTDAVVGDPNEAVLRLAERYRPQLEMYSRAVESILKRAVVRRTLYFFDSGHWVEW